MTLYDPERDTLTLSEDPTRPATTDSRPEFKMCSKDLSALRMLKVSLGSRTPLYRTLDSLVDLRVYLWRIDS